MQQKQVKILYGIQGTGNGHISRSLLVIDELAKRIGAENIDILISGNNYTLPIPYPIKYQLDGITFTYGKGGKISLFKSIKNLHFKRLKKDIDAIDFTVYSFIITDQEPISAWGAKRNKIPSIGIGNVYALEDTKMKRLFVHKYMTKIFQKLYCPVKNKVVFDIAKQAESSFYPMINEEIKSLKVKNHAFTLVYLLSYSLDELIAVLSHYKLISFTFVIYSKEVNAPIHFKNLYIKPIAKKSFTKDLMNCRNIISTAGFQTISEAIYAQKNILLIPINGQPEQKANAVMLKKFDIKYIRKLQVRKIEKWLLFQVPMKTKITDDKEALITRLMKFIQPLN